MNWTLHATLVLILLLAASIARAGGTVGFDPAYPSAGAPFRIHVWSGPCAYLSESPTAATIVSNTNGVVLVRIPGTYDISCNEEIELREYVLPGFNAGVYRLDVVLYQIQFPGDFGTPRSNVGTGVVEVGRLVASIPALGAAGALFCIIAAGLVGSFASASRPSVESAGRRGSA